MQGYDGEGTVPRGGWCESFRQYRERVYGSRSLLRFFGQGALLTLFSSFPTVAGVLFRGCAYRFILGGMKSRCFLEKNIRFFNPGRLFLGSRVFVGEGAFFDIGPGADRIVVGADGHVSRSVIIRTQLGKIEIGRKVNLGAGSFIYGYGDVKVGDYCLLSNQVELIGGSHTFSDTDRPMRFQGRTAGAITIGEDCWIGTHAVILGGVTVGKGSVIGAGAVVNSDIPAFSVAAGVPARVIRSRRKIN